MVLRVVVMLLVVVTDGVVVVGNEVVVVVGVVVVVVVVAEDEEPGVVLPVSYCGKEKERITLVHVSRATGSFSLQRCISKTCQNINPLH